MVCSTLFTPLWQAVACYSEASYNAHDWISLNIIFTHNGRSTMYTINWLLVLDVCLLTCADIINLCTKYSRYSVWMVKTYCFWYTGFAIIDHDLKLVDLLCYYVFDTWNQIAQSNGSASNVFRVFIIIPWLLASRRLHCTIGFIVHSVQLRFSS